MTQPGDVVGWLANFAVRECRVLLDREGRSRLGDRHGSRGSSMATATRPSRSRFRSA